MSFPDSYHLLFYRERLIRFADGLRGRHECPDMQWYKENPLTLGNVADILETWVREAEDDSICHDIYKSMYFCSLPKYHKGPHVQEPGLTWDR